MPDPKELRVKLNPIEKSHFETSYQVVIGDINYGNHLANDAILRICHEVRIRFLANYGWKEFDVAGAGLIMADAQIRYVSQAYHADELTCKVSVEALSRSGFYFLTELVNKKTSQTVAIIRNGMVFFNYKENKVVEAPQEFKDHFQTDAS